MGIFSIFIQILWLTNVSQSLTVNEYKPNYENYREYRGKTKNNLLHNNYPTTNSTRLITNQTKHHNPIYIKITKPYNAGYISNILNPLNSNRYEQYRIGNFTFKTPHQYEHFYPKHTTIAAVSEQPVAAVNIESERTHAPLRIAVKAPHEAIEKSSVNFNNEIYHHYHRPRINKGASPLANNDQKHAGLIVRKQRNLKNINDEKLIGQSLIKDDGLNDLNAGAFASLTKQPSSTESAAPIASHEIRYLHDIFLNYPKPHHVNAGHVELSPKLFEKRFETLKAGNRYKGEVIWLDNTGGYAQHFWDLAQGKL